MRKVIINGRFLTHRITGVERYAREILLELDKIIQPGEVEMAIPPEVEEWQQYENIEVKKIGKLHGIMWEQITFLLYVLKLRAISLNLCNTAPLLSPGIVCIHDMKIKAKPEYFSKKFLMWYNLLFNNETKRAKKIITVSEFSKKEIIKYYGVSQDRIVVIPNAWQHYERIGFDEDTLRKYKLEKNKYYFAMGSMEPNKNFKWIAETAVANPDDIFAIAGVINEKVFSDGFGFKRPPNMILLGYVSDEEAKTLMRDCKAFLFPSIYEGFGIPPLEAMSAGCKKIVVSDTEVMHEIFGDHVSFISMSNSQIDIINAQSCDNYIDVLQQYTWGKSARALYKELGRWLNAKKNLCL